MSTKVATRQAYGETLVELGAENENIVVLDADLSQSTKTVMFAKRYPERFFDMGIAEQNMMATAAGFAVAGKIPFASTFAMFATGRAFEQVRNSIAYSKVNVKIAATHSGITVGEDGGSHQTVEDIAIMRAIPNMSVWVPADAPQTAAMIRAAVEYDGPVYIRLGRSGVPAVNSQDYKFNWDKIDVLQEGADVTIFATGIMVAMALEAAETLKAEGIAANVVNVHTVKPLDRQGIIEQVKKTGAAVTAEEHNILGGMGSAVSEVVTEECPVPVIKVGIKDTFGESGKPAELLEKYELTPAAIVKAVKKAIDLK
ncbi:transketolase [Desulfitispora alkaliphila]|uniref:transketolase family protein n=1 Tax=Desulfitispora alkaliphila TaxID=622674 RepID=UPI003D1F75E9